MVKKWLTCLLAFLLVVSMTLTSLAVFADEEGKEPVAGDSNTPSGDGATENDATEGNNNIGGAGAIENNNGASDSLEGFELVSPSDDDPHNLDLYFYEKELAFKIVQNDANGKPAKVWSSQLLPQDLGIDPDLPVKYAEEKSASTDKYPTHGKSDFYDLNRQIAKAEGLVESNYIASSWKTLTDALAAAKATWNSTDKKEIDEAEAQLKSVIAAMEKKPLRSDLYAYDRQSMSLFAINYVNLGNTVTTTEYITNSYEQEKELVGEVVKTGSGVSFKVFFPKLNITIPLTVEVDGQTLNVTVPKEGLYENLEGAEEVQIATEAMESLIEQINDLIEKTKRLIPKDGPEDKRRDTVGAWFTTVTEKLQLVKEAALTGVFKDVSSSEILQGMSEVNLRLEREGYFELDGVKDNADKITELLQDCMKNYDIIANEIAYGIYSLAVMPYLGSATITEKGYVFYPDGAGAISYFDVSHPNLLGHYEAPVYMDHVFNLGLMWNGTSNASLYPVWGVNKVNYGFVAIIDKGDKDANIVYWPGNEDYVLNRIYSAYMLRRKTKFIKGTAAFESYEINRIESDRKTKYVFLEEDKADYSGMATTYRDYLEENKMLNKAIKDGEKMPLAVDFLTGVKVQEVLWESTITMTTYEQVQSTLEQLRKDGVDAKIYSNLYGWTQHAYNPNPLKVNGALGGKKKLQALTQYASDNNIVLGLAVNPMWAQKAHATGEEMNKYFVRDATTLLVNYNSKTYVYSPAYIQEKYANRLLSKLKDYGTNCAQLNSIGWYLYYDYSTYYKKTTSREETAKIFAEIAKLSNDMLGYSSVSGANMFMWQYASRIDSMPLTDYDYLFSDESVPFLQIVLHGSIPYSGETPYNVMYDNKKQMLQYIEYGCMPYFFLTEKETSEFMTSLDATWNYDWLYSSDIQSWYDVVLDVYKEFSDNVGFLWSQKIVKHTTIQTNVKRVEYSDGSIIYINYGSDAVNFADPINGNAITLEAQSYEVRKGA